MSNVKIAAWLTSLIAAFLIPIAAIANVASVDVTPSKKTLPLNRTSPITLTWTINLIVTPSPDPVTSEGVIFRVNGMDVGETTAPFGNPGLTSPLTLKETVLVPQDVLRLAAESTGIVEAVREFTSGVVTQSATVEIRIGGRLSGDPRVEQVLLRFTDQSRYKMLEPGESAQAVAELRLGNVKRLRGVWEVADPTTAQTATPIYRTIETVNQSLGGKSKINIFSPALPRAMAGPYSVRFRVTDPEDVTQAPAITYYVSLSASDEALPGETRIEIDEPNDGGRLSKRTTFTWQGIDRAEKYRLEIYEGDSLVGREASQDPDKQPLLPGKFVAGVMLPRQTTVTDLPEPTLARLESGETYVWRVVALDSNGKEIAASPTRRLTYLP
jgi:hypothetical protein